MVGWGVLIQISTFVGSMQHRRTQEAYNVHGAIFMNPGYTGLIKSIAS